LSFVQGGRSQSCCGKNRFLAGPVDSSNFLQNLPPEKSSVGATPGILDNLEQLARLAAIAEVDKFFEALASCFNPAQTSLVAHS
jgi:hypothetical protein